MTTTEDKPVDRDAWRRLLEGGDEGPPELTDARIRAKARQALTPRTGRWWLPASLAASLLLAVVLVQQQYERTGAPAIVSESDYAMPQPQDESRQGGAPREEAAQDAMSSPQESDAANAATAARPRQSTEGQTVREQGFVAPAPPVVPPPEIDLPAVSDSSVLGETAASGRAVPFPAPAPASAPPAPEAEAKQEEDFAEITVTGSGRRDENLESGTPVTQATGADVSGQRAAVTGGLMKSEAAGRTPAEWYAEIEKLRAAGKQREARRELEKLKAAHPGWLEENHPTDR